MSLKLTPDTTVDRIKQFYSDKERKKARRSEARLRRLQNLAGWLTDPDKCSVQYHPTQASSWKAWDGQFHVQIPTKKQPQLATDIDSSKWDWLFQKCELIHEIGHVLYTDFDTLEEYLEDHPDVGDSLLFKEMFNAAEDGAIERQLGEEFNVRNDLAIKNANLFKQPLAYQCFNAREAIHYLLLEWAKYDTGNAGELLDPAVDEFFFNIDVVDDGGREVRTREYVVEHLGQIRDYADAMLTEPDPTVRVDATMSFYETVLEPLEHERKGTPRDIPEAAEGGEYHSGSGERADELGNPPEEPMDPDEDDAEEAANVGTGGGGDADLSAEREEAKAMVRSMEKADVDVTLEVPQGRSGNSERAADAERRGKRLERIFKRRLQKVRKTKREGGRRSGSVDIRAMSRLQRGDTRVFEKREKPDDPDVNVVFVGDRSGSMSGSDVERMETAVGSLAYGLDGVDVDTSVVTFEGRSTYLEKPFGGDIEGHEDNLFSATTGGGTPMHRALEVARARIGHKRGQSFVVVVTDGYPDNRSAYLSELEKCSMPVLGVTIGDNEDVVEAEDYYHYSTTVESSNALDAKLRTLAEHFIV